MCHNTSTVRRLAGVAVLMFGITVQAGAQPAPRHCQVNRRGDVCGQTKGCSELSRCLRDAGLLSPSPERLRTNASIGGCGHEMAPRPEVTVDHRVRRQEPLCLAG